MVLLVSPTLVGLAQLDVSPPPPPATAPAAKESAQPATRPNVPSARSVHEQLINDRSNTPAANPVAPAVNTNLALTPAVSANAPQPPSATRRIEGGALQGIGRLVKDVKTNSLVFVFDSDGPQMADPPIGLLPNRLLEAMEQINAKNARGAKFKIAGEITEYNGKNFLLLRNVLEIRDLNQGIGG